MGDTPAAMTRQRYAVVAWACALAVVVYIHRVGFARAVPKLGLDDEQAAWLGAAFLFAYGAAEIPFGVLGDRFGARHLLTVLVVGWSAVTALVAVAPLVEAAWVLPLLLGLRFLFGVFQGGVFPVLSRVLADWVPTNERGSTQGFLWTSTRLGGLVSGVLVGGLMAALDGWQLPLVLIALLGPLWCAGFWPTFRNRPEDSPAVGPEELALIRAGRSSGGHALAWGKVFRSRSVWALCFMYAGIGFAGNFYITLLPKYLTDQRELPDTAVSWLASLPFALGMVACFAGGVLSDWLIRRTGSRAWGRRATGLVGVTVGALTWLALPHVTEVWTLGALLCLIFFCNDLNMAPAWASCADVGERYAGTVAGAMNMMGNCAGAVGNLVAGALFKQGDPDAVFVVFACSYAVSGLCWLAMDPTRKVAAEPKGHAVEQPV